MCKQSALFDYQNCVEKLSRKTVDISMKEIKSKTTWIFQPSKLHRRKYVEITWIFRPSKLYQKKYVENNEDFFTIKITLKKVRATDVDFLIS